MRQSFLNREKCFVDKPFLNLKDDFYSFSTGLLRMNKANYLVFIVIFQRFETNLLG